MKELGKDLRFDLKRGTVMKRGREEEQGGQEAQSSLKGQEQGEGQKDQTEFSNKRYGKEGGFIVGEVELDRAVRMWSDLEDCQRGREKEITTFVSRFEEAYLKWSGMSRDALTQRIKVFMLAKRAPLTICTIQSLHHLLSALDRAYTTYYLH